jgi:uncharacterized membrane protein YoaK (UPF0700 family)
MNPETQNRNYSLTAARYTLTIWVIYILPFVAGLIIINLFRWSYFWPSMLLLLTLVVIALNLVVVVNDWYRKPIARYPIILQLYGACFFGVMILGKARNEAVLYVLLVFVFLLHALLGYYYRKKASGVVSRIVLVIGTLFPIVYAFGYVYWFHETSMFLEAPGMISSICMGLTYFCAVIVESVYRY